MNELDDFKDALCLAKLQEAVDKQTEDHALWFQARTAPEAYLQQELRRLHEIIEGKTSTERALELLGGTGP